MNSLINLLHLKFFCDAVVYKSVSEAAKMNFVTQSAVSQAIAKLEKVLGTQVVIHTRQKFQVTEEGKIVFEQARHIFKTIQQTYDKLNQNKETVTGTLKFVSTNSLGMSFIASSYNKMKISFPHVNLSFRLGNLNYIRNALRQGEAEFGIVVYDQNFSQFNKHPLKKGQFRLYQNAEAPLHLIENEILVDYFEGMNVQELRDYFVQTNRSELKLQTELAGWEVVARFTEMNIGIGFFPDYVIENGHYPTIKPHPLQIPSFEYEICAIFNKGEQLSRAACAFIDQFALR